MASAELRDELTCSICQDIYADPVTLPCGHNFCRGCIRRHWDWQKSIEEDPSCPECRQRYRIEPELITNEELDNIAKKFLSIPPKHDGPDMSWNCPVHNEPLKYHCCEDEACVCASCCLFGDHKGHRVELLSEASEKKKEKLRKVLEKLSPEREETERGAQRLQERRRKLEEKSAIETERVTALFRGIREELEALEKRLLSDISRQKEELTLTLTELIQQLEIKKDELSRKIRHIEELCNMADPLTVLQEQWESHGADFCGAEEADNVDDLDVGRISETLLTGLAGIVTGLKGRIYGQEATELVLDTNTAGSHVSVSGDGKSASCSHTDQCYPQTPMRFQVPQVLSTRSFPSGRHYWEVEGSESGSWKVGAAYPSIERGGIESWIGENNKSWCLYRQRNNYSARHYSKVTNLPHVPSCSKIRISLDYEAGHLSFYELSEPIRHLHTFTASFTEPLHAAFWVWRHDAWVRISS
ncbi:E3 ubiquitin-protein ligase TRIM7 [Xenopus tropicalis]|uniref:E3 ubiquitin-protein ligase TRIM7 n=1 Tax=Xenopus tropicalis TaxID=8364 RepID=A0A8J0SBR0_XENTR|nr:E3 ubiquitin-protein ligase TRIM7 [Xenopus tropicalis]